MSCVTVEHLTLVLDYTGVEQNSACFSCSDSSVKDCHCTLTFNLDTLFKGPVFFYYGLTNYFQNQRAYGVSKDDYQLSGDTAYFKSPDSSCAPYEYDSKNNPIVPCGSLANSMFNDSFVLYQIVNGKKVTVPLDGKGIAWWTDYNIKYRNPSVTPLKNAFNDYPVMSFDGRKKVVFSNVSWMGGKNEFLGLAYLVIGSLCLVMSVVMLIVYAKFKFPEED
ncbi:hypothetical protein WMY93_000927 [Mugilogobius chulae]|uniref:Cell cycle control protein n=1 Tax=Mugilogobius chulae TaxID=88201 RepID=A0AAW0QFL7_9GOBI